MEPLAPTSQPPTIQESAVLLLRAAARALGVEGSKRRGDALAWLGLRVSSPLALKTVTIIGNVLPHGNVIVNEVANSIRAELPQVQANTKAQIDEEILVPGYDLLVRVLTELGSPREET